MAILKAGETRGKKGHFQMSGQMKICQISLTVTVTIEVAEVTQESVRTPDFVFRGQCQ